MAKGAVVLLNGLSIGQWIALWTLRKHILLMNPFINLVALLSWLISNKFGGRHE